MVSVRKVDFDIVHDIQSIYRKMLYSLSYPGKVYDITAEGASFELGFTYNKSLALMAICVADAEVTCCVLGDEKNNKTFSDYIRNFTYSRIADKSMANYIFVSNNINWNELVENVNCGTLIDPHESATLFIKVDSFDEGKEYEFKGPGIKEARYVRIKGLDDSFFRAREEACSQFPIGIDVFLCDPNGKAMGIPRTTMIKVEDK